MCRLTDHAQHNPNGLTKPWNLQLKQTNRQDHGLRIFMLKNLHQKDLNISWLHGWIEFVLGVLLDTGSKFCFMHPFSHPFSDIDPWGKDCRV